MPIFPANASTVRKGRARGHKKQQRKLKLLFSSGCQKVAVCYHIICFAIFKKQLYQKKNGGLQRFCGIRQLPIFPHSAARSHGVAAEAAALCSLPSAAPLRCIRHWRRSAPLSLQPRRFAPWLATWLEKSGSCRASQKETPYFVGCFYFVGSGSYLSFRAVASQVLSAYKGLTSVFGMGTGGTP